jgi:hypothetical protein
VFGLEPRDQAHGPRGALPALEDGNDRSGLDFLGHVARIQVHRDALMREQQLLEAHLIVRDEGVFPVNRHPRAVGPVQHVHGLVPTVF